MENLILPALIIIIFLKIDRDERKLNRKVKTKDYPIIYKKKIP